MADEFRTYDKAPIVGVVRISRWSFGLREIILAIIAGLLLVLCLVFAGLFGNAKGRLASKPSASAIVGTSYCVNPGCLKTAARAVSLMNKSVDPCENFYQFACGNYKKNRPIFPGGGTKNVITDLREVNEDRIIDVMEQPISALHDYAAERKLKKFFQSCNDMFVREQLRGLPILSKVLPELGGWKLLGTWDADAWDLNTALKKVQSEFWVDALYAPRVVLEQEKGEARIIRLDAAGVGKYMRYWWYLHPYYERQQNDYKKFIRRVGSLLYRDQAAMLDPPATNASQLEDLLDEFVNDTFTMEHQIAYLDDLSGSGNFWEPVEPEKVTLNQLTTQTGGVIDWTTQMTYLFNTAGVTGNTQVNVMHKSYFTGLSTFLSNLPEADRKRMVHNYLIWRVVEGYVQEMSWEYIHANRELYVDMYGYANFMGVYRYCFHLSEFYMGDALNHLYITQFLSKENKDTAHEITDNLKSALQSQLSKTPWMDAPTRKYAMEKLDLISFKIGYPDWMANQGEIDDMYSSLVVNASDFFGNVLRMNRFRRALWNTELHRRGTAHEEWVHSAYETTVTLSLYWNEVAAPAGLLQFPIYDAAQPHTSTFGSLGSIMAMFLHRFVDEYGNMYDKHGEVMEQDDGKVDSWWSNSTLTKYKVVKDCVKEVYSNLSQTVKVPDGPWQTMKLNASYMATHAMTNTNGMRLALLGYKAWAKVKGLSERMVAGLDMNHDQMMFLAHAQSSCEVSDEYEKYLNALYGSMATELHLNMVLGQMDEFSTAFQCSKDAKMNHAKKCQYY